MRYIVTCGYGHLFSKKRIVEVEAPCMMTAQLLAKLHMKKLFPTEHMMIVEMDIPGEDADLRVEASYSVD